MLEKARVPSLFPADIFLSDSTYFKASILYKLVGWTGLRLEDDRIGLGLHLGLNGLLLMLAVAAVRDRLADGNRLVALLAVLVSCFFYTKLVEGARATPISYITPTPTGLGHVFGMAALFLAMLRRPALAALCATLCVAIAPKGNILIVPALVLWPLLDRSLGRRDWLWMVLPVAYVGVMSQVSSTAMTPEQKLFMTQAIINREEEDGVFTAQPLLVNILLPAAFAGALWLARSLRDPTVKALLWSLTLVTAGGWLVMLVYPLGLQARVPLPILPMLSIPQSTKFFIWLILTVPLVLALASPRLSWYEKLAVVAFMIVLRPFPKHAALAALILCLLAVMVVWRERRGLAASRWGRLGLVIPLGLAAMLGLRMNVSYVGPDWIDPVAYAQSGSWSGMVYADDETWRDWKALADLPDFPLLAFYRYRAPSLPSTSIGADGTVPELSLHTSANVAARKSVFQAWAVHGYTNPPLWFEAQKRSSATEALTRALLARRPVGDIHLGTPLASKENLPIVIEQNLVDFLGERHMAVMVPSDLAVLFPPDLPKRQVVGHTLIGFGVTP